MSLEKQFRWVTDKLEFADVSVGKALLLLLFMGVPGKFIVRLVRYIMAYSLDTSKPNYFKNVDRWTQGLGTLGGFLVAWLFKNWKALRGFVGETGAEAISLSTLAGAIDAGFQRSAVQNRDLTNYISRGSMDKVWDVITKIKGGVALAGPKETAVGRKVALGAFPEAASSAFEHPREEEYIVGPEEVPKEFTPAKPVDPVQRAEEILAEKSKI